MVIFDQIVSEKKSGRYRPVNKFGNRRLKVIGPAGGSRGNCIHTLGDQTIIRERRLKRDVGWSVYSITNFIENILIQLQIRKDIITFDYFFIYPLFCHSFSLTRKKALSHFLMSFKENKVKSLKLFLSSMNRILFLDHTIFSIYAK